MPSGCRPGNRGAFVGTHRSRDSTMHDSCPSVVTFSGRDTSRKAVLCKPHGIFDARFSKTLLYSDTEFKSRGFLGASANPRTLLHALDFNQMTLQTVMH